jgi:hypothetical protein
MDYYVLNFLLMTNQGYSLYDLENMIPFEREIYTAMLIDQLKEKKEKLEIAKQNAKHK